MAIGYSKDKYARIKNLKNEPLANLISDLKKRKLSDEKADTSVLPPVQTAPSSPTSSLEVIAATLPLTRARGKTKVEMSVWDDPAIALGRAHNVITNDELKGLSSIPSHELVSQHIHKLVQIDTEVLEDESKELEGAEFGAVEKDKAAEGKDADESTALPS
nr:hypothetical protein CFP56_58049 [Quercus suber]